MTDQFRDQHRAEHAFEDYLADRAQQTDFAPLNPAELTGRRDRRWRPTGLIPIAAAFVAAAMIFGIGSLGNSGSMPAVPAGAVAEDAGAWQQTAPIPIGQRYGAISLWTDGSFFILGGTSHCGLDEQGNALPDAVCRASLPSPGKQLADGARFDPVSDSWTRIADAPVPIGQGSGVVAGDAIYLVTEDRSHWSPPAPPVVLRYDPATNTWSTLPSDPDATVLWLLSWDGELYASTISASCETDACAQVIDQWDTAAHTWRRLTGPHPALTSPDPVLASVADGFVSLSAAASAAFTTNTWHELPAVPLDNVVWAGAVGNVVVAAGGDGSAASLDLADPQWHRVPDPPAGRGVLIRNDETMGSPRFTDGTQVTVGGHLYNPITGEWTTVPPLPNPDWTFGAFAGNGTQILACYVGPQDSRNDCYLLQL